jgi:hypothetical protein
MNIIFKKSLFRALASVDLTLNKTCLLQLLKLANLGLCMTVQIIKQGWSKADWVGESIFKPLKSMNEESPS